MPRKEKYPWSATDIGQSFQAPYSISQLYTLRAAANHQFNRNDRRFTITHDGETITVTRETNHLSKLPWSDTPVGEAFPAPKSMCTRQQLAGMARRMKAKGMEFSITELQSVWIVKRTA